MRSASHVRVLWEVCSRENPRQWLVRELRVHFPHCVTETILMKQSPCSLSESRLNYTLEYCADIRKTRVPGTALNTYNPPAREVDERLEFQSQLGLCSQIPLRKKEKEKNEMVWEVSRCTAM